MYIFISIFSYVQTVFVLILYVQLHYYACIHFLTEFEAWKDTYESETNSQFVKATGTKGKATHSIQYMYYYCNRSGFFTCKNQDKRSTNSRGSDKLDAYCTALIVVTHDVRTLSTEPIAVTICKTHYGHQCSLGAQDYNIRTGKLMQGNSLRV